MDILSATSTKHWIKLTATVKDRHRLGRDNKITNIKNLQTSSLEDIRSLLDAVLILQKI